MTAFPQLSAKAPAAATRPEVELLLCCARTHIDTATAEQIKILLQQDIDWAYLIQTALWHGVMPLLYCSLKTTCPEAVPNAILNQLRAHFQTNAIRNQFLTKELLKLLNLFEAHGIPAIPFKGPVLAASAYGNLALRQFGDLDILVHERDVLRAKDLLISQGYLWRPRISQLAHAQSGDYVQSHYLYDDWFEKLDSNGTPVAWVEIHWETTPRHIFFPLNSERLWECLERVSLCGTTVLSLPPEALLPILCVNHTKDHWRTLKTICDVAELIRVNQGIDWGQTIEHGSTLGRERTLFLGLSLASDLLGTTLPEKVMQRLQTDPVVKSLAMQVCERLFHESSDQLGVFDRVLFNLSLRESLQDKVRYCIFTLIRQFDKVLLTLSIRLGLL